MFASARNEEKCRKLEKANHREIGTEWPLTICSPSPIKDEGGCAIGTYKRKSCFCKNVSPIICTTSDNIMPKRAFMFVIWFVEQQ